MNRIFDVSNTVVAGVVENVAAAKEIYNASALRSIALSTGAVADGDTIVYDLASNTWLYGAPAPIPTPTMTGTITLGDPSTVSPGYTLNFITSGFGQPTGILSKSGNVVSIHAQVVLNRGGVGGVIPNNFVWMTIPAAFAPTSITRTPWVGCFDIPTVTSISGTESVNILPSGNIESAYGRSGSANEAWDFNASWIL